MGELHSGESHFCLTELEFLTIQRDAPVLAPTEDCSHVLHMLVFFVILCDNVINNFADVGESLEGLIHSVVVMFADG